jgi:hypothetical protein
MKGIWINRGHRTMAARTAAIRSTTGNEGIAQIQRRGAYDMNRNNARLFVLCLDASLSYPSIMKEAALSRKERSRLLLADH